MGTKKYNIEDIRKEFDDRGYTLLETEYINVNTPMRYICRKHEDKGVQTQIYKHFRNGIGCRYCGYEKQVETKRNNGTFEQVKTQHTHGRWTYEEIVNYIEEHNPGCKLLTKKEEYKNTNEKILISCSNCGEPFTTTFNDILHEDRHLCIKCSKDLNANNYRLTYDEVKEYIESQGYKLLDDTYKNQRIKLKLQCPEGHIVYIDFGKFKFMGRRCNVCNGGVRYTYEKVKEMIESVEGYILKSDYYHNFMTDLIVECPEGHEYHTYLQKWDAGARCPICNESKQEKKIRAWLELHNFNFQGQYIFDDLKGIGGNPLKYDFAVFDVLGNVKIIVEHDGIFHFESPFNDEYRLNLTQTHDKIKDKYCEDHDIPILRIPYWEDNKLEEILENNLLN